MSEKISPKLKLAMGEIRKILEKNDIAGVVILHTPGSVESLVKTDPGYSCLQTIQGEEFKVKIKITEADFKCRKDMEKCLTDTSDMLYRLTQEAGTCIYPYFEVSERLDKKMKENSISLSHGD